MPGLRKISYYLLSIGFITLLLGILGNNNDESLNMIYIIPILGGILSIISGLFAFVFTIKNKKRRLVLFILLIILLLCIPLINKYVFPEDAVFSVALYL